MIEPKWVNRKALEVLHGKSLAMFGGAPGLRDSSLLDSALARPKQVFSYSDTSSLSALAAAYAVGICRNHPFVDGNKRAALLAALVFLELNGYGLVIGDRQATLDAIRTMEGVASGDFSEEQLTEWIEARCWRIDKRRRSKPSRPGPSVSARTVVPRIVAETSGRFRPRVAA